MEDIFQKVIENWIGNDEEKIAELKARLEILKNDPVWDLFFKILKEAREKVLENFKNSSEENLLAYRESLIAIDFLINLPEELSKFLNIFYSLEQT